MSWSIWEILKPFKKHQSCIIRFKNLRWTQLSLKFLNLILHSCSFFTQCIIFFYYFLLDCHWHWEWNQATKQILGWNGKAVKLVCNKLPKPRKGVQFTSCHLLMFINFKKMSDVSFCKRVMESSNSCSPRAVLIFIMRWILDPNQLAQIPKHGLKQNIFSRLNIYRYIFLEFVYI